MNRSLPFRRFDHGDAITDSTPGVSGTFLSLDRRSITDSHMLDREIRRLAIRLFRVQTRSCDLAFTLTCKNVGSVLFSCARALCAPSCTFFRFCSLFLSPFLYYPRYIRLSRFKCRKCQRIATRSRYMATLSNVCQKRNNFPFWQNIGFLTIFPNFSIVTLLVLYFAKTVSLLHMRAFCGNIFPIALARMLYILWR